MVQFRIHLQVGNDKICFGRILRHLKVFKTSFWEKNMENEVCKRVWNIPYNIVVALICFMSDYPFICTIYWKGVPKPWVLPREQKITENSVPCNTKSHCSKKCNQPENCLSRKMLCGGTNTRILLDAARLLRALPLPQVASWKDGQPVSVSGAGQRGLRGAHRGNLLPPGGDCVHGKTLAPVGMTHCCSASMVIIWTRMLIILPRTLLLWLNMILHPPSAPLKYKLLYNITQP